MFQIRTSFGGNDYRILPFLCLEAGGCKRIRKLSGHGNQLGIGFADVLRHRELEIKEPVWFLVWIEGRETAQLNEESTQKEKITLSADLYARQRCTISVMKHLEAALDDVSVAS